MIYQQLSLFDTQIQPDEIKTVQDFVAAAYKAHVYGKEKGWIRKSDTFVQRMMREFDHHRGGTCPDEFAGFTFYDFSPQGVRLTSNKPYRELKFSKKAIIGVIQRGEYLD